MLNIDKDKTVMASEQERKEAFLRVWLDAPDGHHWAYGMSNEVEKSISETFDEAIVAYHTRPAPAATDTGLVRYDLSMFGNGIVEVGGGAYVRFDQAEELLAAAHDEKMFHVNDAVKAWNEVSRLETRVETLEADNAAKDARIKELEKINTGLCHSHGILNVSGARLEEQVKALEAKLTAAQEAHKSLFGDKTMENILWPDVKPTDLITIRVQKKIYDKARAVLGGKPS